jgi:hypothetical protein
MQMRVINSSGSDKLSPATVSLLNCCCFVTTCDLFTVVILAYVPVV